MEVTKFCDGRIRERELQFVSVIPGNIVEDGGRVALIPATWFATPPPPPQKKIRTRSW